MTSQPGPNPLPEIPLDQAFPFRTDMTWLTADREPRPRATPSEGGLRLRDVESADTLAVPDRWPFDNDFPRGAIPSRAGVLAGGYTIYDKASVWADSCIDLYEAAIAHRWSSANDIPWTELTPLPPLTEAAIDQLCTELSEHAYLDVQVLSAWLERIAYGFKEVKNFLATHIFARARHVEAFRKRALANGGGLGVEGPGIYHRAMLGAPTFPDLVLALFVRNLWTATVCAAVAERAPTPTDATLFRLAARDLDRFNAYVTDFLHFHLASLPERKRQIHATLNRHELLFAAEWPRDESFSEALALTLADTPADGITAVEATLARFRERYRAALAEAGLGDHVERLPAVAFAVATG